MSNYIWCMKKRENKTKTDVNQYRNIAICKKINCKWLEVGGDSIPHCTHSQSFQYVLGFKKIKKGMNEAQTEGLKEEGENNDDERV